MIYVDLPVRDLEASKRFFGELGFEFDARFTDDIGACMILDEDMCVMLLPKDVAPMRCE